MAGLLAAVFAMAAHADGRADAPQTDSPDSPPRARALLSQTQRFMAVGTRLDELLGLLVWVEQLAGRVEQCLRSPLPLSPAAPLRLVLVDDASDPASRIEVQQAESSGQVHQLLRIRNPQAADPEDVLDVITWLLLSRYAQAQQSPAERRFRLARAPAWWTEGLARDLMPGARARAREQVRAHWEAGRPIPLNRLLAPRPLARGAGVEKAFSAQAIAWLRARRDFKELHTELTRRWAAGQMDDAEVLAARMAPGAAWREIEMEWELWLAGMRLRQDRFAPADSEMVRALRAALTLQRGDLPDALPTHLPDPAPLEALITYRGAPWASEAARRIAGACDRLRFGCDAQTRTVIDAFLNFLQSIQRSGSAPRSPWAGWWESRRLQHQLDEARRALAALEVQVLARQPETAISLPPASSSDLERRAWLEIFHDLAAPSTSP